MQDTSHTVKSFEGDLQHLHQTTLQMGSNVVQQIEDVRLALKNQDAALAQKVIDSDDAIDLMEYNMEQDVIKVLALRQPVAKDLRNVIAALKISSHLERIGDYAVSVAKRVVSLSRPENTSVGPNGVDRMLKLVKNMVKDILEAYEQEDDRKAKAVWKADVEIDDMYMAYLRELLTYMMEDPRHISACAHYLLMAKHIERMGDHTTNIAEKVHYLITGDRFTNPRPKGEGSSSIFDM